MNEITLQFIQNYLFLIKSSISQNKYQFIERKKNIEFLRRNGLTIDDLLLILFDLSSSDYVSGPENDRDTHKGAIWKFKYNMDGINIYIKINYNPPNDINIISFHENE